MFARLFAESGLSLDRLRALVEVAAAGSIARAAGAAPVRQSQYSRQIKELEEFFRVTLFERQAKGIQLTDNGRELARISRFFLLGLSNFQRGCLAEERTYRIGASATFIEIFLVPVLSAAPSVQPGVSYAVEALADDIIERRLHELTLDFGIVTKPALSRPLQLRQLGSSPLNLCVPKALCKTRQSALRAFKANKLPLISTANELPSTNHQLPVTSSRQDQPYLTCNTFLEARAALKHQCFAALLPEFLDPGKDFLSFHIPRGASYPTSIHYQFAWNPRLLRLNPQATRRRDFLAESLSRQVRNYERAPRSNH
jgi:DNA-binding transcriptional LysR family regulator